MNIIVTRAKKTVDFEHKLEVGSSTMLLALFALKAFYGDYSYIGILAKKLITYVIFTNLFCSFYRSIKNIKKELRRLKYEGSNN